jgi:hypothetical protein
MGGTGQIEDSQLGELGAQNEKLVIIHYSLSKQVYKHNSLDERARKN